VSHIVNFQELNAWACSGDGEENGFSGCRIEYDDGRKTPAYVEKNADGEWVAWSSLSAEIGPSAGRNEAAISLVSFLEELDGERRGARKSGTSLTFHFSDTDVEDAG